jgi:Flp pilus assembly pilin Flp
VKLSTPAIEQGVITGLIVAAIVGAVVWLWHELDKGAGAK